METKTIKSTSSKAKLWLTTKLFALNLLLLFGAILAIHHTASFIPLTQSPLASVDATNIFKKAILGMLVAPILEELAFRYHLSGQKRAVLISIFFTALIWTSLLTDASIISLIPLAVSLTIICICYILISKERVFEKISVFYNQNTFACILISSILFSLSHMFDATWSKIELISLLTLMLPTLITGTMLSLTRLWCGIKYSVLFHCVHNSLLLIPTLLVLSQQ